MKPKAIFELFRDSYKEWSEDKAARLGAALAYYTIFSIVPLLLISIAIAGLIFSQADVQRQMISTIRGLVGGEGATLIEETLKNANEPNSSIPATVFGLVTLVFGASGVFGQLQDALNTIWEVKPKPGQGILAMLKARFFSFTMVLGTGFLLLVSLIVTALVSALGNFLRSTMPGGDVFWQIVNFFISLAVVTVIFALLFKYVPDIKIGWKDVWLGAALTAILFTIGKYALGMYLGSGSVGSSYGAAGALVILLVWIYYSSQILFFGAEFTQVYTNKHGSRVQPAGNAEFVTEEARAQEGMPREGDTSKPERERGDMGKERPLKGRLASSPWFK